MRPELVAAERNAVVRDAARSWREAGVVGEDVLINIESRYPVDRVAKTPIWRVLIFVFSCVILCSLFGLLVEMNHPSKNGLTVLCLFFGGALAVATEFQQGPLRFDGTGGEAATSLLSLVFLMSAAFSAIAEGLSPHRIGGLLVFAAFLFAAGWWRWALPAYAAVSAVSIFFAVSNLVPFPRAAWIALADILVFPAGRLRDRARLAPAQRTGISVILAAGLAAGYAALNLYSFDRGVIEDFRSGPSAARLAWPLARALFIAATALYPVAVLAAGARTRNRLLIDLGLVFSALSLVTLRAYVHLGPLWLVLTEGGVALVVLALAAERFLAAGPNRERGGLTAEPLFEDESRVRLLSAAAVLATLSPDARSAAPEKGFSPGGGGFGGGGASGEI